MGRRHGALLLGARAVLAPSPDPETVFSLVAAERVTWIPAVPASVITWLNSPLRSRYDLTSIRTLAVGGSRLNPEPARSVLAELGPVLTQVFGHGRGPPLRHASDRSRRGRRRDAGAAGLTRRRDPRRGRRRPTGAGRK
ncbi:MAG: hypothetical protein DME11_18620 [Candidatus Rokuibacteriota bacterium]|nr:MAG: hypothetical protein DME11_18620 [Candidatus Rokubacteria bacterium]PYN65277.1 MAG: hypothetical protein DMD93_21360 [Candidatus Rokubacteria bacterium]